jgi:AbrB family looped-hinge helix DNA binding protein
VNEKIVIGRRGAMTLPAKLRKRYGLGQNDELIVEETAQGILLRPSVSMPVEYYSEERIAEFAADDAAIGEALERHARKRPDES